MHRMYFRKSKPSLNLKATIQGEKCPVPILYISLKSRLIKDKTSYFTDKSEKYFIWKI